MQHMIVRAEHAPISNQQTLINMVISMLSLHSNRSYKSPPSVQPPNHTRSHRYRPLSMLHRVRNTPHPHLLVSSGRRSWHPAPPWTLHLWAAPPAGPAGPPGSLCSRRRRGCSQTSSPSASPCPCVRKEASFRCC